uniref:Uncharacterized protein n=1 Tax=Triticum urartu TaxID=4572 RepID=A0A8R7R204_TRIUA
MTSCCSDLDAAELPRQIGLLRASPTSGLAVPSPCRFLPLPHPRPSRGRLILHRAQGLQPRQGPASVSASSLASPQLGLSPLASVSFQSCEDPFIYVRLSSSWTRSSSLRDFRQ